MTVKRGKPIYNEYPLGPWRARVTVTPLEGFNLPRSSARAIDAVREGRSGDVRFEVRCEWVGPGLPDEAEDPRVARGELSHFDIPILGDVDVSDAAIVDDRDQALALARRAGDKLRVGEIPDLRVLVGQ